MDDIEEVIYSQRKCYQAELHDRSQGPDDDTELDQRRRSQTNEKYKTHEQEHLNRFGQLKQQSLLKVYLFTSGTSRSGRRRRS